MFTEMGDVHKAAAVQSNLVTALRAMSRIDEAWIVLDAARKLRTQCRPSAFENEMLSLEEAELLREAGQHVAAKQLYTHALKSECPIHRVLAFLGLGELQRMRGEEASCAYNALTLAKAIGFLYGKTHAMISIYLTGQLHVDALTECVQEFYGCMSADVTRLVNECRLHHRLAFPS